MTPFLITTKTKQNYISAALLQIEYWPSDIKIITLLGEQYRVVGGILIDIQGIETYFEVVEPIFSTLENLSQTAIGWKEGGSRNWISHPYIDVYFDSLDFQQNKKLNYKKRIF